MLWWILGADLGVVAALALAVLIVWMTRHWEDG